MKTRTFDDAITYINDKVTDMEISRTNKMELLGMIAGIGFLHQKEVERLKAKRTKAEWLPLDDCMTICSNCNSLGCDSAFCPNCGADMRN